MKHLALTTIAVTALCTISAFAADNATTAPATMPNTAPAANTTGTPSSPAPATMKSAPTTNAAPASPAAASATTSSTGIQMADHAKMALKFTTVTPADLMSSKLIGLNVYNNQNDKLGEIEDLAIDHGNTIKAVVVSVGGFLGMGESYVLVDPSSLVVSNTDNSWKAFVDTSKDTLKNAPKFSYKKNKS